jgi:polysaccharide biosynthesis/export protein
VEGPYVPIVYSVGFVDPSGYFLATQMQMRSKDLIFVANATSLDITKFAAFLNISACQATSAQQVSI